MTAARDARLRKAREDKEAFEASLRAANDAELARIDAEHASQLEAERQRSEAASLRAATACARSRRRSRRRRSRPRASWTWPRATPSSQSSTPTTRRSRRAWTRAAPLRGPRRRRASQRAGRSRRAKAEGALAAGLAAEEARLREDAAAAAAAQARSLAAVQARARNEADAAAGAAATRAAAGAAGAGSTAAGAAASSALRAAVLQTAARLETHNKSDAAQRHPAAAALLLLLETAGQAAVAAAGVSSGALCAARLDGLEEGLRRLAAPGPPTSVPALAPPPLPPRLRQPRPPPPPLLADPSDLATPLEGTLTPVPPSALSEREALRLALARRLLRAMGCGGAAQSEGGEGGPRSATCHAYRGRSGRHSTAPPRCCCCLSRARPAAAGQRLPQLHARGGGSGGGRAHPLPAALPPGLGRRHPPRLRARRRCAAHARPRPHRRAAPRALCS